MREQLEGFSVVEQNFVVLAAAVPRLEERRA